MLTGSLSQLHEEVLKEVLKRLTNKNYSVIEFVYHECLSEEYKKILSNCFYRECLLLRSLPDLLVIKQGKSFFMEIKAKSPQYPNLAIELFPFVVYYYLNEIFNLKFIYIYGEKNEKGFLEVKFLDLETIINEKLPSRVILTEKFDNETNEMLKKFSKEVLNIKPEFRRIKEIRKRCSESENVGSADPFLLISQNMLHKFKDLNLFY